MTADEWMTVGEGTAVWVHEMILQRETVDVSDFYTGLQPPYSITDLVKWQ
jgi:hypothetical protein